MDELSAEDGRSLAVAANLRRAFGAPKTDGLPPTFAVLLRRLDEVQASPTARLTGAPRPEA